MSGPYVYDKQAVDDAFARGVAETEAKLNPQITLLTLMVMAGIKESEKRDDAAYQRGYEVGCKVVVTIPHSGYTEAKLESLTNHWTTNGCCTSRTNRRDPRTAAGRKGEGMSPEAANIVSFLVNLPTGHTMTTRAIAREILLATNGDIIVAGNLRTISVKHKGAGVYAVRLAERKP